MTVTIQHKRSSTPGAVPTAGQLAVAELAVNTADGKLFTKKADNSVVELGGSGGLGIGQTWQNMTASRALNTVYTNTTGQPIAVIVRMSSTAVFSIFVEVDGQLVYGPSTASGATALIVSMMVIVPPGSTYRADGNAGTRTLNTWYELRA